MTMLFKTAVSAVAFIAMAGSVDKGPVLIQTSKAIQNKKAAPKIQAAILLDVSNSMDGLIGQAKTQLWNMVSVMGKAKCDGQTPEIEIALYEYGSPRNDIKAGYVKQISSFTTDLDGLSEKLFALTTNGGSEYCGHVIYSSIDELKWDTASSNYKVIFIAGNEDFLQGDIHYTKACDAAKNKGIIVNTIYCGDKMQGIREHWNLLGECGNGTYTNINQNLKEEYIATPYDSSILVLNTKLNNTYISYGAYGYDNASKQRRADVQAFSTNAGIALKRASVKGNKNLYKNSNWDLVDASTDDSTFTDKVDMKTLPDSLKNRSRVELRQVVDAKKQERIIIQGQIQTLNAEREKFIAEEKKNKSTTDQPTLQTETEKMIRQQAKQFNMVID